MTSSDTTLYERIGGSEAIEAAIEAFYERVLDDEQVSHYYSSQGELDRREGTAGRPIARLDSE